MSQSSAPTNSQRSVVPVVVNMIGALVFTPPVPSQTQGQLRYLCYRNSSLNGFISYTRSAAVGTGVAMNGPTTVTLAPGQAEEWSYPGDIPLNPIYAIGSALNMNLTVEYS